MHVYSACNIIIEIQTHENAGLPQVTYTYTYINVIFASISFVLVWLMFLYFYQFWGFEIAGKGRFSICVQMLLTDMYSYHGYVQPSWRHTFFFIRNWFHVSIQNADGSSFGSIYAKLARKKFHNFRQRFQDDFFENGTKRWWFIFCSISGHLPWKKNNTFDRVTRTTELKVVRFLYWVVASSFVEPKGPSACKWASEMSALNHKALVKYAKVGSIHPYLSKIWRVAT